MNDTQHRQRPQSFGDRIFLPRALRVLAIPVVLLLSALTETPTADGQSSTDVCATSPNAIVRENCLPGSPDWRPGAYSLSIQGFASSITVAPGDPLVFFADTAEPTFTLRIYRAGYYGGLGAREVAAFEEVTGGPQPACHEDFVTGLISCEHWRPSVSITVPENWVTGVYMARFETQTGAYTFTTFIVRDDVRASEVVVQIPVTTYQAYNNYGGKSTYDSTSGACNIPESNQQRAVAVSFDRPYANTFDDPNNFLRNDHLWVMWLEEQGYDVSYITNIDVHRWGQSGAENGLLKHRAFLSIGHDEYWSQEMWNALVMARDAGVHLGFFSANTSYWRIRLEPSLNGIPDRILVTYKTVEDGLPDPSGIPTSTWRDPAQYGLPENQLLGSYYTGDNDDLYYPIRVTSQMAQDRVYRNTGLQSLPPGTTALIGSELIGWEWNSVVASPLNPPGLVILAESPVAGTLLTDAGNETHNDVGQTLAHIVRYTAASGAYVFNAGTIQWGWGLAGREPNSIVRQITYNVLADMGIQPHTPVASLVLDGQTGVAVPPVQPAPAPRIPVISGLRVTPTTTGAIVEWETDIAARGQAYHGLTAYQVRKPQPAEDEPTTTHRRELVDLQPDTDYYVRTISLAAGSDLAVSETIGFRTLQPGFVEGLRHWAGSQWTMAKCAGRPFVLPTWNLMRDNPVVAGGALVVLATGALGLTAVLFRRRQATVRPLRTVRNSTTGR